MKKLSIITILLVLAVVFSFSTPARAQSQTSLIQTILNFLQSQASQMQAQALRTSQLSTSQRQAEIERLTREVEESKKLLETLKIQIPDLSTTGSLNEITTVSPTSPTVSPSTTPGASASTADPIFTRNLSLGARGQDVQALQSILNRLGFTVAQTGAGSPGNESTYFGPATQNAVIEFQQVFGISPTGFLGSQTREIITMMTNVGESVAGEDPRDPTHPSWNDPFYDYREVFSRGWPEGHHVTYSQSWIDNDHKEDLSGGWPAWHWYKNSITWPNGHKESQSKGWPPNHQGDRSQTWPHDHQEDPSRKLWWPVWADHGYIITTSWLDHHEQESFVWPPGHIGFLSLTWHWPNHHKPNISLTWPPNHNGEASHTWPPGHLILMSETWPGNHQENQSATWPPNHEGLTSQQTFPPSDQPSVPGIQ